MYKETSTQTNKRRGDLFFALYLVSVVEDEQWGQNTWEVAFLCGLNPQFILIITFLEIFSFGRADLAVGLKVSKFQTQILLFSFAPDMNETIF